VRRPFPPPRALVLTVVAGLGAVALAVCVGGSGGSQPRVCPSSPSVAGVAVAVGGHGNAPQPGLPASGLQQWLAPAEKPTSQPGALGVTFVRVDGSPSVACVIGFDSSARNKTGRKDDETNLALTVQGLIGTVRAKAAESNPLLALSLAGDAAGPGGTVLLVDSGLQTVAPLDFVHQKGLFSASPESVADQLQQRGDLPHLDGQHVALVGIGQTYAPQAALSIGQRDHLVDVWRTIALRAGAVDVKTVDTPDTTPPLTGLPPVTLVPVPPDTLVNAGCNQESVFPDDGPVGFVPEQTEFLRPAEAKAQLAKIGAWLAANPQAKATIGGSIAHYGNDDAGDPNGLSTRRADQVAAVLEAFGAQAGQLTANGQGWGPYPSKNAPHDGGTEDQMNRRVVVDTLCP
jgi:OmpA-OmpF porin, OOP family